MSTPKNGTGGFFKTLQVKQLKWFHRKTFLEILSAVIIEANLNGSKVFIKYFLFWRENLNVFVENSPNMSRMSFFILSMSW